MQLVGQVAEFKMKFKFRPLLVMWLSLPGLFQKAINNFKCKIKGRALGAVL